jgi:hypothetical protein
MSWQHTWTFGDEDVGPTCQRHTFLLASPALPHSAIPCTDPHLPAPPTQFVLIITCTLTDAYSGPPPFSPQTSTVASALPSWRQNNPALLSSTPPPPSSIHLLRSPPPFPSPLHIPPSRRTAAGTRRRARPAAGGAGMPWVWA